MKPVKYKCIVVTKRGPPENLQITEFDLRDPSAKEVRVKVLATCVCLPDVQNRYGLSPFASKVPFVPGYAIIGVVDAVGPGVKQAAPGVRVAAYLMVGGYAEYVYLRENLIIPVPPSLDPAEAVPLLLNYLTAYQALHRSAKVKAGDKVLIIAQAAGAGRRSWISAGLPTSRCMGSLPKANTRSWPNTAQHQSTIALRITWT